MSAVGYDLKYTVEALWKVLVASLILGAGLPTLFATGIRALAWGEGGDAEISHARPNHLGRVIAIVLFLVVLYGIVIGLMYVIATGQGGDVQFRNGFPWVRKH